MANSPKELGLYLKEIRESFGYSTYDVNKKTNISQSYLSLMENGKRKPSAIILKKLAPIYNLNYLDLYEKAGYIDLIKDEKMHFDNNMSYYSQTISIPILGKISAGLPLMAEENKEGSAFAPANLIKPGYNYFYLRVVGDSMNLKFNEGDIILVQKQDSLENGDIGVIRVNGFDATIKKYRFENNLVLLEPMSTNIEHKTQIYNPKEIEIAIIGKAISYQGNI